MRVAILSRRRPNTMRRLLSLLPLGAIALAACSQQVSLGDPTPGVTPDPGDPGAPPIVVPDPTPPLVYPDGPYGVVKGSVLKNFSWEGYRDGTGEWGPISMLDYYNPDLKKPIKALKLEMAATW